MGVEILTETAVAEIRVTAGRASEVVTTNGDVFRARVIASGANAKAVYLDMLNERDVPPEVLREVRGYRTFSTAFKMNIACERPPQYRILDKAKADGAPWVPSLIPPIAISRLISITSSAPMTTRSTAGIRPSRS